jgi:hypothetical protein
LTLICRREAKAAKGTEFQLPLDFRMPSLHPDPEELQQEDMKAMLLCHPWTSFLGSGLWHRRVGQSDTFIHSVHATHYLTRLFGRGEPSALAFGGAGMQLGPVLFCEHLFGRRAGSQSLEDVMRRNPGDVLALTSSAFYLANVEPGGRFPLRAWTSAPTVFGTSELQKAKVAFQSHEMTTRDGQTWFSVAQGGRTLAFQWGSSGGFEVEVRHYLLSVSPTVSRHLVVALKASGSLHLASPKVLVGWTASPDLGEIFLCAVRIGLHSPCSSICSHRPAVGARLSSGQAERDCIA